MMSLLLNMDFKNLKMNNYLAKANSIFSFYYHPSKDGWNSWIQNIERKGKFIAYKIELSQDELSKNELPLNCH